MIQTIPDFTSLEGRSVLVTGAAGFIGRRLTAALDALRIETIGVGRRGHDSRSPGLPYVCGDITSSEILDKIDVPISQIVHLAGRINAQTRHEYVTDNVHATMVVADWASKHQIERIIYVSTVGVYAPAPLIAESSAIGPSSTYALTKYLGEQVIVTSGIPYAILRPSFIYGPGDRNGFIARLYESLESGSRIMVRDECRDFIHVDDVVDGVIRALGYTGKNEIFCFGSGRLTILPKLATSIAHACGKELSHVSAQGRSNGCVDWGLARKELAWTPAVSLEDPILAEAAYQEE
ncbi:NAD-dependent epimerase/dehydratase family protein [Nonomuraea typhae]|uniref:NAD-dependent epimerase/dehydratase family protein n=1 Tax=Nonomuraea typhae TaxID=2603600 RepID=UPI0012FB05A5